MPQRAAPGVRDRVLEAATRLFYENGVRAVGMQQIITAAGCGKMLLYREFAGKSELVAGYLEIALAVWNRRARKAARGVPEDDPAGQLTALLNAVVEQVNEPGYRGCPFRNYLTEFSDHGNEAGRIAVAYLKDLRTRVGELVHQLGLADPDTAADQIWLVVEGLYGVSARFDRDRATKTAVALVQTLTAK